MKQSNEKLARDRSPWHDTELTPREQNIVRALLRIVRSDNPMEAEAMTRMITRFDRYIARRHKEKATAQAPGRSVRRISENDVLLLRYATKE
jgi:hypothetical protein